MVNSRKKGKYYELHVAGLFRSEGYNARRGQQYSGANGDADIVGVRGLHIECKAREKMQLYDWLAQAKKEAQNGVLPVVVHKKNYYPDLVTMDFRDWIKLYREYELNMEGVKDK